MGDVPLEYQEMALHYALELETTHEDTLLYNKDTLLPFIKDKKSAFWLFKSLLELYENLYYASLNISELKEQNEGFRFLLKKDSNYFLKKIHVIMEILDELNYNLNISLVLDRFVLEEGE